MSETRVFVERPDSLLTTKGCRAPAPRIDPPPRRRQHGRTRSTIGGVRGSGFVTETTILSSVLACPRCRRGPVTLARAGWMCDACSSGFPVIGDIPWLFPDPRQALAEWRGRLGMLTEHLAAESAAMRAAASAPGVIAPTRRRLEHGAAAHEDQIARLRAL